MRNFRRSSRAFIAAMVGLVSGFPTLAAAQSQNVPDTIDHDGSIFVDGKSFKITPGRAKGDASAQIKRLGARDLGAGAIIFRSTSMSDRRDGCCGIRVR
jgi:hypothetical protein